jgi:5-formyltetrahydrofolate cyclo-ligase
MLMREILRGQNPTSDAVVTALDRWLGNHDELHTIAVFSALPGEVDVSPLANLRPDLRWVYPKVANELLTFHEIHDAAIELVPGAFGIPEPAQECPEIRIEEIDAFICPGLAFDRHGGRLGRGRGFYDRMLAQARAGTVKIGVCFEFQRVPETYAEDHDIRMDRVFSD